MVETGNEKIKVFKLPYNTVCVNNEGRAESFPKAAYFYLAPNP